MWRCHAFSRAARGPQSHDRRGLEASGLRPSLCREHRDGPWDAAMCNSPNRASYESLSVVAGAFSSTCWARLPLIIGWCPTKISPQIADDLLITMLIVSSTSTSESVCILYPQETLRQAAAPDSAHAWRAIFGRSLIRHVTCRSLLQRYTRFNPILHKLTNRQLKLGRLGCADTLNCSFWQAHDFCCPVHSNKAV